MIKKASFILLAGALLVVAFFSLPGVKTSARVDRMMLACPSWLDCGGSSGDSSSARSLDCPDPLDTYYKINPLIPGGSQCRWACGWDCGILSSCRNTGPIDLCVGNESNHRVCRYETTYICGSHPACVTHDNCYDGCIGQSDPELCRRGCDDNCLKNCGEEPCSDNCPLWAVGKGPQPLLFSYSSTPVPGPILSGPCP